MNEPITLSGAILIVLCCAACIYLGWTIRDSDQ